ncbi:hypothetical protein COO60DRAFT_1622452 [Scenedesmus sp. NREL 46B-D3]|nr:hypothetical protein COO60DRAFT_1622452 [Scenedesmus sp. NREL 46B-D3]
MTNNNKLDFITGVSLLPFDLNNLGAVYSSSKGKAQCVASRCSVVVRRGWDDVEQLEYGNVVEALGDVGFNLRSKDYAFHISASNLAYKAGTDSPLRAQSLVGNALASLKVAYAQQVSEDRFLGVSYDFSQRKPELSLAWAGDTFTEQSSLAVSIDPIDRAARLRAAVSFPGLEWRRDVWDHDTRSVQLVQDDGSSRHTVWAEHEARRGQLLAATKLGARLDLGRLANISGNFVDRHLKQRIPLLFWKIPLSQKLYRFVVPAQDQEQMRYNIKGWCAELSHDFDRQGPTVGLSKRLGDSGCSLAASYDAASSAAGIEMRSKWVVAAARLARQEDGQWRKPSVQLLVQPLGFL